MSDPIMENVSSRRTILTTGAAGLALAATGCSVYGKADPADDGEVADKVIGKAADVPVGGSKVFPEAKVIVSQPTAGRYVAFSAVCTHQGCTVNKIEGAEAVCPCHGSKFKVADGTVAGGPASSPLPSATVELRGDDLVLVK
ncbi:Rieske (2Fe-2S) protein [Actinocorallia sp. B10E7]|uniref:Rieske (2Fe-2S) protein n=1 Tax=Actinocorallia sp. B10E7 TaxID=3153558 RepID=UPI00325E1A20